jgi:hypothetical protein
VVAKLAGDFPCGDFTHNLGIPHPFISACKNTCRYSCKMLGIFVLLKPKLECVDKFYKMYPTSHFMKICLRVLEL